jgi:hypothetical protein
MLHEYITMVLGEYIGVPGIEVVISVIQARFLCCFQLWLIEMWRFATLAISYPVLRSLINVWLSRCVFMKSVVGDIENARLNRLDSQYHFAFLAASIHYAELQIYYH